MMVGPQTIDELNILNATLLGMRQAVEGLAVRPGLALIDGNRCPEMEIPRKASSRVTFPFGEYFSRLYFGQSPRDRYMEQLAKEYPQYQLKSTRDIRPSCITRCWTNTAFSRFTAGPF
ncbi:MAG: hypothetical protein ACLRZH_13150 [Ruthenibacterium lactatiformans]